MSIHMRSALLVAPTVFCFVDLVDYRLRVPSGGGLRRELAQVASDARLWESPILGR